MYTIALKKVKPIAIALYLAVFAVACTPEPEKFEIAILGGTIYDGSGEKPYLADIGIRGDTVAFIGQINKEQATKVIDAQGKAVCPGFINSLSWAAASLLEDGRSMSDLMQGITLEVFGEGESLGPRRKGDFTETTLYKYQGGIPIQDTSLHSLGDYMQYIANKGVSTNIASFVGAATIRAYVAGYENTALTASQLDSARLLVKEAMQEGAIGLGTSLIYPPGAYASTDEIIEMAKVVAEYDGLYSSHMRSEGNKLVEAVNEVLEIAQKSGVRAEIHHLKAAGKPNWYKLDTVLQLIEQAQVEGLPITTNMYNYTAASTGLGACLPPWSLQGGTAKFIERLDDAKVKKQIIDAINSPSGDWENFYQLAGGENILLVDFDANELKGFSGMTLREIAAQMSMPEAEAIIELIRKNGKDIVAVYFLMSDENVARQIALPYMSFVTDARSIAAEGQTQSTHPRAYGSFARVVGHYVRDEKVITLEEAIRKLAALPAQKLGIERRGLLKTGYYADILIFDPAEVNDPATFASPHQYATGMVHIFVNGVQVIENGKHTGATPGRFVKGKGALRAF